MSKSINPGKVQPQQSSPQADDVDGFSVRLPARQWDVIAQSLDNAIRTGGIENARVVIPVFDSVQEQIRSQQQPQPNN